MCSGYQVENKVAGRALEVSIFGKSRLRRTRCLISFFGSLYAEAKATIAVRGLITLYFACPRVYTTNTPPSNSFAKHKPYTTRSRHLSEALPLLLLILFTPKAVESRSMTCNEARQLPSPKPRSIYRGMVFRAASTLNTCAA